MYDVDYSINYETEDNYSKFFESDYYHARIARALLNNSEWKVYFEQRFEEIIEECFETSNAIALQRQFEGQIAAEIPEDLARWDVYQDGQPLKITNPTYWYEKMEDLRRFFVERPEYAKSYFYAAMENYFSDEAVR